MNAQFEKVSLWSIDLIDKAVILSQSVVYSSVNRAWALP